MTSTPRKYWAFISYSHQDEVWAQWLHTALETYRVPRRLVGRPLQGETIPRRLFPIFRDRAELPSSHELGAALTRALEQSRNLIVICSPRAASSRWVNEEIRAFRQMERSNRVYCLIVDGEPNAADTASECFAPALRGDANFEPIAADVRENKDGKSAAKLKLISGLLDLGLDELIQREKQRQFWDRVRLGAAAMALAGLVVGAWQWVVHQRETRELEIRIEKLVESGRSEQIKGHDAKAAVYLNQALKLGHDTVPLRYMLGQAMQSVESISDVRIWHDGQAAWRATFSPDGSRFMLVALGSVPGREIGEAKVYDRLSGQLLKALRDAPPAPRKVQFGAQDNRLLMTGFPDTDELGQPVTVLWDLDGAETPVYSLAGYSGRFGLPMAPDGTRVLRATADGLAIHDAAIGNVLRVLARGTRTTAASYSPDGRWLAFASSDGAVELWPSAGTKPMRILREAEGESIVGVSFTPDSQRLLSVSALGDLRIWDINQGRLLIAFAAERDGVHDIQFSRDGRRLLTIGIGGYKVWSVARGVLLLSIPQALQRWASAALSPDGDRLVIADAANSAAAVWDVESNHLLTTLDGHTGAVTTAAFNAAGTDLLLGSADGTAEIWSASFRPLQKVKSFENPPYLARFLEGKSTLIVARGDRAKGSAEIYDVVNDTFTRAFDGHDGVVYDVASSRSGERLVTASADGSARLWDLRSGEFLASLASGAGGIYAASFSVDGRRLLTTPEHHLSTGQSHAGLWDARDGRTVAQLMHAGPVFQSSFSPDGSLIATAGGDHLVRLWKSEDGQPVRNLTLHSGAVRSAVFNRGGHRLLSAGQDNRVVLWDTVTGAPLDVLDDSALQSPTLAIFNPDEDAAVIGTQGGRIWIWPLAGGKPRVLLGHQERVTGLRFARQGRLLFSHSADGTVRAWDLRDGRTLGIAARLPLAISAIELDDSETQLLSSSYGEFSIWDIGLERRSAAQLAQRLRCNSPWAIDQSGERLVQSRPEPGLCAATSASGGRSAAKPPG